MSLDDDRVNTVKLTLATTSLCLTSPMGTSRYRAGGGLPESTQFLAKVKRFHQVSTKHTATQRVKQPELTLHLHLSVRQLAFVSIIISYIVNKRSVSVTDQANILTSYCGYDTLLNLDLTHMIVFPPTNHRLGYSAVLI